MRIVAVAVIIAALSACAVSRDNYPHAWASAECSREKQCDKGSFDNSYSSTGDCIDTNEGNAQTVLDFLGGFCNYDDSAAGKCIQSMRTVSCADFQNGNFDSSCDDMCSGSSN